MLAICAGWRRHYFRRSGADGVFVWAAYRLLGRLRSIDKSRSAGDRHRRNELGATAGNGAAALSHGRVLHAQLCAAPGRSRSAKLDRCRHVGSSFVALGRRTRRLDSSGARKIAIALERQGTRSLRGHGNWRLGLWRSKRQRYCTSSKPSSSPSSCRWPQAQRPKMAKKPSWSSPTWAAPAARCFVIGLATLCGPLGSSPA